MDQGGIVAQAIMRSSSRGRLYARLAALQFQPGT